MEDPDSNVWDSLPLFANGPARYLLKDQPVGQSLGVWVRATAGSKAPARPMIKFLTWKFLDRSGIFL